MLNKAILMGRLTKDPEVRYSQNSLAVCNYTLVVDRRYAKQGEEKQTDFLPIVTFGKTAEFCEKYFRKGQQVAVSGRIQTRSWDANDGTKRYMTEIIAEDCYFADSKRPEGNSDYSARPEDYGYYPQLNSNAPSASFDAMGKNGSEATNAANSMGDKLGTENSDADDGFEPIDNENDLPF